MFEDEDGLAVHIDVALVRKLVAQQFPQWAALAIREVEQPGHDNRTFRLGDTMAARFPNARPSAAHVATEQKWLPILAPHLPLPVPLPVAEGMPAIDFPWRWTVNEWLTGRVATSENVTDMAGFAHDLAVFLRSLQSIDATDAPPPGVDNFYRGAELMTYDHDVQTCVTALPAGMDVAALIGIWERAASTRWNAPPVWLHGDIAPGNLLIDDGRLCAVIDFGQLAAGDPACDLAIAWTFFDPVSRGVFQRALNMDSATWWRGQAWALWKALLILRADRGSQRVAAVHALRVVNEMLAT